MHFSARPEWKPEQAMNQDSMDLVSGRGYGFRYWNQLFTDRQLVALSTLSTLVDEARSQIRTDALKRGFSREPTPLRNGGSGAVAYSEAVSVYLAFLVGQIANHCSAFCGWNIPNQHIRSTFSLQAIPMVWDFAEVNVFSSSSGSLNSLLTRMVKGFETLAQGRMASEIVQLDAASSSKVSAAIISTDPPYYDNIGYADLSDFFFCWIRHSLRTIYPDLFSFLATPKEDELVATTYRHGSKAVAESFFMSGMSKAIANMSRSSLDGYPTTIYYAFKQNEIDNDGISSTGWATFLQAVIDADYSVVGTWPMRTERPGRMISVGTNALANSVVLVCRTRGHEAGVIGRAEFIRLLKRELPPAIEALQKAHITPADMPQSAIGPGMGVFSRYNAVLEADDSRMSAKTALQLINRELDEYLSGIQGEFDPETRFALNWYEQYGVNEGEYGIANSIATARGVSVEGVRKSGIVVASSGRVRILKRDEIDPKWEPAKDSHPTVWKCGQHLVKAMEHGGEGGAAKILKEIGHLRADATRDLAYCLYDIAANKRRDASEATAWNGLIAVWSELIQQAETIREDPVDLQDALEF